MSDNKPRYLESFGPKLYVETGSTVVGFAGKTAYQLVSVNADGLRYNQSFHEGSGLARFNTDSKFQFECGDKIKSTDVACLFTAHKGGIEFTAEDGIITFKATQIVIEGEEEVVIQGRNIRLGYQEEGATKNIRMLADDVPMPYVKEGKLSALLMQNTNILALGNASIFSKPFDILRTVLSLAG